MKIESDQTLGDDVVAQLAAIGITGTMFVELVPKQKDEPDVSPPLEFPTKYPVIPSKPSNLSKLMEGIDDMLGKINALNLDEISRKVGTTLDAISQAVADANIKGISSSAQRSLQNVEHALARDRWDRILSALDQAAQSLSTLMNKAEKSLDLTESSLATVDQILRDNQGLLHGTVEDLRLAAEDTRRLMEEGAELAQGSSETLSRLERHLVMIARNLERASANLERLTERAADNPSQVLFGEPPAPREERSQAP
jgi:phospholipid/cholesterol/gamma-HCH transport system substrate-binding protein